MSETTYTPSESIVNESRVTYSDLEFIGLSGGYGAAIFNKDGGNLTLKHTRFLRNSGKGMGGAVFNTGTVAFNDGVEFIGNSSTFGGGAIFNAEGSTLTVTSGAFSENTAERYGGVLESWGDATIGNATFTANSALHGGALANTATGTMTVTGCVFTDNDASATDFGGGAISNAGTITIKDTEFSGNTAVYGGAIYNLSDATAKLTNVSFRKSTDTIVNEGTMTFSGSITLAGNLDTESVIKATGVALTFDISQYTFAISTAILEDFTMLTGVSSYSLAVGDNQVVGIYTLAKNASAFKSSITLKNAAGATLDTLSVSKSVKIGYSTFALTNDGGLLQLIVTGNIRGNQDGLAWNPVKQATSYEVQYSTDNFATTYVLQTAGTSVCFYGMPSGTWQWRARALDGDDTTWQSGAEFSASRSASAMALEAVDDGLTDVFFAQGDGVWDGAYMARNMGAVGKAGTGEVALLEGKSRIGDLFAGGSDANVLFLTDGANGDALFIDDVYTALPDGAAEDSQRLSGIQEIFAGAGDDLVDLTSDSVSFSAGGITVHGGDGQDVIWANSGSNMLFGDAGDDRIVGGYGADVIVGGTGNDSLHGGGGRDVFCFGEDWGADTVEQFAGSSVTLWFASGSMDKWNAATSTYTDGENSVTVIGVDAGKITLNFGASDSPQRYATLVAQGAFA